MPPSDDEIAGVLCALADERGRGASFCPSEAARRLADDWRPLMDDVRRVAEALEREGRLRATQGGATVSLAEARGPIRLSQR